MKKYTLLAPFLAMLAGVVFAAGLTLGGMTDPRKVQGFLNVGGMFSGPRVNNQWDPSLAFVMGGALLVSFFAFMSIRARVAPWAAEKFELPTKRDIDARLLIGATLFGIGWGVAGYCPGPAFASLLIGGADILWFVGAMVIGMMAAKKLFK
jgi:uncharacterized protein